MFWLHEISSVVPSLGVFFFLARDFLGPVPPSSPEKEESKTAASPGRRRDVPDDSLKAQQK